MNERREMTAKMILSLDGVVLQDCPLDKERMTIGRRDDNDIVINNLAVSSRHAAIITLMNDSFIEDLDSTNGMQVNGDPVKKRFLQSNDLVEIGKYRLKYINDQVSNTTAEDFEKTMVMRGSMAAIRKEMDRSEDTLVKLPEPPAPAVEKAAPRSEPAPRRAVIQILNGPNAGRELELVKNLTTLGKPGVQVAVLTRRPQGYFITHVEGEHHPVVNGVAIGAHPCALNEHDLIELVGIKMEFFFRE